LIYVPTPDPVARRSLISGLLKGQIHRAFTDRQWAELIARTEGYSRSSFVFIHIIHPAAVKVTLTHMYVCVNKLNIVNIVLI
jgi:hypothetical protein